MSSVPISTTRSQQASEFTPIKGAAGTKVTRYTPLEKVEDGGHHVYLSPAEIRATDDIHIINSPLDKLLKNSKYRRCAQIIASFAVILLLGLLFNIIGSKNSDIDSNLEGGILGSRLPFPTTIHPEPPTALWGVIQKPYPTGAFWSNFAVRDGEATVVVYPYSLQCKTTGVHISYGATRRRVTQTTIIDDFADDLIVSSVEPYASRSISNGGKVAATVEFTTTGSKSGK